MPALKAIPGLAQPLRSGVSVVKSKPGVLRPPIFVSMTTIAMKKIIWMAPPSIFKTRIRRKKKFKKRAPIFRAHISKVACHYAPLYEESQTL